MPVCWLRVSERLALPPLDVAHESTPAPLVERTCPAVPSADGSVQDTLAAMVDGACSATQLLLSASANRMSPCALSVTSPVNVGLARGALSPRSVVKLVTSACAIAAEELKIPPDVVLTYPAVVNGPVTVPVKVGLAVGAAPISDATRASDPPVA